MFNWRSKAFSPTGSSSLSSDRGSGSPELFGGLGRGGHCFEMEPRGLPSLTGKSHWKGLQSGEGGRQIGVASRTGIEPVLPP